MWIRSQNQENYLDASGKTFSIYNGNQIRMNVFYSGNNTVLSISSTNNVLATLEETNTFEMPQDEDE